MTQEKSRRHGAAEPAADGATGERAPEMAWWSGCGCSPDQFRELKGGGPMASCESMMSGFSASTQGFAGCCGPSEAAGPDREVATPAPEAAFGPEAPQPI